MNWMFVDSLKGNRFVIIRILDFACIVKEIFWGASYFMIFPAKSTFGFLDPWFLITFRTLPW